MAKTDSAKFQPGATKEGPRKKILIVDDHPMMREGLRGIISREPDLMVCGEADCARKAMLLIEKSAPDLALVDITLPEKNGLELVKDLKALHPELATLVLSMHDESLYGERMLRAGAKGYINKHQPPEELLKAIRMILDGRIYVSPEMSESVLQQFSSGSKNPRSPLQILTDREVEIFQLFGQGKTVKEIALQLCLSDKTVAVHSANIRQKLKVKTTAKLIRLAVHSENTG
ncbi:MAG: response regulator transcription factor [Verrucomicrobiota bacterium]